MILKTVTMHDTHSYAIAPMSDVLSAARSLCSHTAAEIRNGQRRHAITSATRQPRQRSRNTINPRE